MDAGGGGATVALLRLAAMVAAFAVYCAPVQTLAYAFVRVPPQQQRLGERGSPQTTEDAVLLVRMWLTLATTLLSLFGVVSTQLVVVSCVHAAFHFLRFASHTPLLSFRSAGAGVSDREWSSAEPGHTSGVIYMVEAASMLSFLLVLRFVLFPPASALANFHRRSRQLRGFFRRYDQQYEPLVETLLEDYAGHERLLYARLRRIYRDKLPAAVSTAA